MTTTPITDTLVTDPCLFCGKTTEVELPADVAAAVRDRTAPIQQLLPDTSIEVRELLISGIHPDCWTRNFG